MNRDRKEITNEQEEMFGMVGMFTVLTVVMISWVHSCVKTYQTVHFNYVQFIVCQLYFNRLSKTRNTNTKLGLNLYPFKETPLSFYLIPPSNSNYFNVRCLWALILLFYILKMFTYPAWCIFNNIFRTTILKISIYTNIEKP